jgi:transcriptional regulator with XRE-family HTH domain
MVVDAGFVKALCARTRAVREACGMTRTEMATALGVGYEAYRTYETRCALPHRLIARFSQISNTTPTYLFTGRSANASWEINLMSQQCNKSETQFYQTIGQMIHARRKAVGMTLEQLAAAVETTHSTLSRIENGKIRVLVHTIYDFAEALGCLPGDLVPKPRLRRAAGSSVEDRPIDDVNLAIKTLGGNKTVARLCSVSSSAVSNWRAHGVFPPRVWISISQAAKSGGVNLSETLFREQPRMNGHIG